MANAVEMQQATLEQQLASAKGEFRAQRIELGERLKPAVITLINAFTTLLDNISSKSQPIHICCFTRNRFGYCIRII